MENSSSVRVRNKCPYRIARGRLHRSSTFASDGDELPLLQRPHFYDKANMLAEYGSRNSSTKILRSWCKWNVSCQWMAIALVVVVVVTMMMKMKPATMQMLAEGRDE